MANKMKWYDWLSSILLIAGGINWGLAGVFNYNLVNYIFGGFSKFVYVAVALSAVYGMYWILKTGSNKMDWMDKTAFWLLIIGGLNWGFVVWELNLVELVLGALPLIATIVYGIIGVAGLYSAYTIYKVAKN